MRDPSNGPSRRFEELAWIDSPLGEISLRRRHDPTVGVEVYEVKLDDAFLMSSLFTAAEIELASRGLALLPGDGLDVVVGGLGLGYTAATVLRDPRVRSLLVLDFLDDVIGWHQQRLLPCAEEVAGDQRCRLEQGDFFALTADAAGYDRQQPGRAVHAILVDIDHSPRDLLHPRHARFYTVDGLRELARHLRAGGVFGLWSNDPPDDEFTQRLATVFAIARAEVVEFDNPLQRRTSTNTIYLAQVA
ncbi:spermidine synthase [Actinoplanes sp. NPDC023801]|uniref:spermidine synthase n=1 Tax=Actinoplanes sp. NPDC023801 TaxID=3154595 RepID=UPI0033CAE65A